MYSFTLIFFIESGGGERAKKQSEAENVKVGYLPVRWETDDILLYRIGIWPKKY